MNGVESVATTHFWWVPFFIMGLGAIAICKAAENGVVALSMWLDKDKPIAEPWLADSIKRIKERGEKPPHYAWYATCWLAAGATSVIAGLQLWR